ncbi:hypothetical protein JOF53_007252 [Crossiella equi]|uniref:Uncharacterized protein n=1 Tax=Crossiella equi TaxID=130796 RepID=A0ABS5AP76_9PSEU|nr:hypothetical protein [Crossiella equi]MBP2478380.1 hypothetical protein [Crossiella equi]
MAAQRGVAALPLLARQAGQPDHALVPVQVTKGAQVGEHRPV